LEMLRGKPLFAAHGTEDPVVPIQRGRQLRGIAEKAGLAVEWHEYEMGHMVLPEELRDAKAWLQGKI
jgi:phospholipase/carboxylesterase